MLLSPIIWPLFCNKHFAELWYHVDYYALEPVGTPCSRPINLKIVKIESMCLVTSCDHLWRDKSSFLSFSSKFDMGVFPWSLIHDKELIHNTFASDSTSIQLTHVGSSNKFSWMVQIIDRDICNWKWRKTQDEWVPEVGHLRGEIRTTLYSNGEWRQCETPITLNFIVY
jgi:hypothetical protein